MKYFLDTEFLEGAQKTWFGQTKPTIDLISIGIVAEDGREYYAISKDFNIKEAWNRYDLKEVSGKDLKSWQINRSIILKDNKTYKRVYWLRDNVLKPIWEKLIVKEFKVDFLAELENPFTYKGLKYLIKKYGKTNKQIAKEIYDFISETTYETEGFEASLNENLNPEFYGYFADYDWVVFCWLFGNMIDLPKGFPMYCIDLKQILDEKAWSTYCNNGTLNSETSLEERLKYLKGESNTHLIEPNKPKYPKQTNEHNALADARWNYELYKFLNAL